MSRLLTFLLFVVFFAPIPLLPVVQPTTNPVPPRKASKSSRGVDSGKRTRSSNKIYIGPRGGKYHYSKSGKKVYEKKEKKANR